MDGGPSGVDWSYEMKWDGVRAIALVGPNAVELRSRAGNEITLGYPELQPLADSIGPTTAVLDGEIVAIDEQGRSNFQRLQSRMHLRDASTVARFASQVPVTFMIFDLLWFDGHQLTELAYAERRSLLDRLGAELATRPADTSPFADRDLPRDSQFVNPNLVVEVRFTEWTEHHHLRHPAYLGQRDDKDPRDVRRE